MTLTIILLCAAAFLIISALSLALHTSALGRILVYGGSLTVSAVGLAAGLAELLGQGPAEALTLPLGLPWLGAHFRIDALQSRVERCGVGAREPLLALPLVLGILVSIGALFLRLNSIAFGEPRGPNHKAKGSYVPMFAHLGLVLVAGTYLPAPLVAWFQAVAKLLG
jgi:hydrogenase-4 component F